MKKESFRMNKVLLLTHFLVMLVGEATKSVTCTSKSHFTESVDDDDYLSPFEEDPGSIPPEKALPDGEQGACGMKYNQDG